MYCTPIVNYLNLEYRKLFLFSAFSSQFKADMFDQDYAIKTKGILCAATHCACCNSFNALIAFERALFRLYIQGEFT